MRGYCEANALVTDQAEASSTEIQIELHGDGLVAPPSAAQWGSRATWHVYRAVTKAPGSMPSAAALAGRLQAQPRDASGRLAIALDIRGVLHGLLPDLLRAAPSARVLLDPVSRYILVQAIDAGSASRAVARLAQAGAGSFLPKRLSGNGLAPSVTERLAAWIRNGVCAPFVLGDGCDLADPSRTRFERVAGPVTAAVLDARAGLIPVALGLRLVPGIARDDEAPWMLAFDLEEQMILRNTVFSSSVDASPAVRTGILLRCAVALDAALWPDAKS